MIFEGDVFKFSFQDDFVKTYDWERGALTELYKEYRSVLWQHKLSMRSVAILLFDSDTMWGRWDPITRTILISRKLIQNHSWYHVQVILRHEMAHQLVSDFYNDDNQAMRPHGEAFKWACQKLGVPHEFSSASANLQETPLNWRDEKKDDVSEKLLDKVRKLLALATSSNEHEALLAMEKVRELYAKYNLEQAAEAQKSRFAHLIITHGKKRLEPHESRTISILTEHFFVEALTCSLFDAKSGEYHRAIELIGTRENVLMAEYVYHFLLQQSVFLVEEAVKLRQRKISRIERKSFRLGILAGFSEKLKLSERPKSAQPLTKASPSADSKDLIGTAIMKFRQDKHLDNYMAEIYPRISRTSRGAQYIDSSAFAAGKTAGLSITLNKGVSSTANSGQGRLLEQL